ncbi:MAG: hypothetical protein GY754_14090 [bacterium]|nr:hypothetical protein [bacterium]
MIIIRNQPVLFFIAAAASFMLLFSPSTSRSNETLTIEDVVLEGKGLTNPALSADYIYATNNSKEYSKDDIKKAEKSRRKGFRFYRKKKDKQAIPHYLESLKTFPTAQAYYNLANSLMNVYKYKKAEISYLTALKYRPRHHLYNYNLACAYSLMKNIPESHTYLKKALETGYNNFAYIWRDRDMKNARRSSNFNVIMKEYESTTLTKAIILKEGYCEVDHGIEIRRFTFGKNKSLTIKNEGRGPYAEYINESKTGTWYVQNGMLRYKIDDSRKTKTLYLKLGRHECTY